MQILVKKSNSKGNWISYVVGCHLSKHYKKALYILGQYLDTLDLGRSEFEYEDSEVQLYKAQVRVHV